MSDRTSDANLVKTVSDLNEQVAALSAERDAAVAKAAEAEAALQAAQVPQDPAKPGAPKSRYGDMLNPNAGSDGQPVPEVDARVAAAEAEAAQANKNAAAWAAKFEALHGETEEGSGITHCDGYLTIDGQHFETLAAAKRHVAVLDAAALALSANQSRELPEEVNARLTKQFASRPAPDVVIRPGPASDA